LYVIKIITTAKCFFISLKHVLNTNISFYLFGNLNSMSIIKNKINIKSLILLQILFKMFYISKSFYENSSREDSYT